MTLNELFRRWLEQYVAQSMAADQYLALMDRLGHVQAGRPFRRPAERPRRKERHHPESVRFVKLTQGAI